MLNDAAVLIAAGQVAKVIATLLYAAIAAALVLGERRIFAESPRNFLEACYELRRDRSRGCPFATRRFGAILHRFRALRGDR